MSDVINRVCERCALTYECHPIIACCGCGGSMVDPRDAETRRLRLDLAEAREELRILRARIQDLMAREEQK